MIVSRLLLPAAHNAAQGIIEHFDGAQLLGPVEFEAVELGDVFVALHPFTGLGTVGLTDGGELGRLILAPGITQNLQAKSTRHLAGGCHQAGVGPRIFWLIVVQAAVAMLEV